MSAFVGVRRSRQVQLWLVAILCGLIAPAYAEDPPATGFQLPGFSLPTNLFGGKQKTPAADDADQPEDASKSSEGKKAKPAKKKAEPQPADPAQAAKEKAAADKAMQDSTAKVVEMLFSKVQGQVKVGSAALNWSEPISVRKLDISDPDGDPVLSIEEVQLSRSLSQMMLNPKAPAGTKLIRPQFFVTVGEENTNLQRVLGAWFLAEIAGKDPRDTNLEIVDGHVHVVKEKTGEQFLFTPLNFAVVPHPDDKADRKISLSWEAPLQEGKFHFEARYHRKTDRLEILTLEGDYAPLALGATLAGEITGMSDKQQLELNGTWRYDLEPIAALGRAKGWDVSLVGRKTQPIRIAVDLHELSSSLLAREVKANPAGGTSPTLPVVVPEENPPQAAPPGPQLPNPNPRPPRDESEEVPVMPTSFRQPAKKAAPRPTTTVQTAPVDSATNFERTPANSTPEPAQTESTDRRRHWAKSITVETTFAWDSAQWAEVPIGPAEVVVRVRDGWALALPTQVEFSEGVLNLAGGVFFAGERLELAVPAGPFLENVRLTPELCDYVLTWVAPFVARSTNIQGFMSVELDRCLVRLDDAPNSDVRGRVMVDRVRMDVSDLVSNLTRPILGGDVRGPINLRLLNESTTEFHFAEGRMFHEGMGFVLGDKTLYTNGSIGLDHALDLLIDLTLPLNWLPNGPLGRKLKGTRVQVPVIGTLEKPRIGKVSLPNGLGAGLGPKGPLSRLLKGLTGPLPPGQPPYGEPGEMPLESDPLPEAAPRDEGDFRGPVDPRDEAAPPLQVDPRAPVDPRGAGGSRRPLDPRAPADSRGPVDPRMELPPGELPAPPPRRRGLIPGLFNRLRNSGVLPPRL